MLISNSPEDKDNLTSLGDLYPQAFAMAAAPSIQGGLAFRPAGNAGFNAGWIFMGNSAYHKLANTISRQKHNQNNQYET